MKKILLIVAVFCLTASISVAAPMYYTFQGSITSIKNDSGLVDSSLIGQEVEQVWVIDFAADGFQTLFQGDVTYKSDYTGNDYFYADFYSGFRLTLDQPGYFSQPSDIAEYNYGHDSSGFDYLLGNSRDEQLAVRSVTDVTSWAVGMSNFRSWQVQWPPIYDLAYLFDAWYADGMTLTSISSEAPPIDNAAPVPEPSTILLLGSGLAGLAFYRRKKK